MVMGMAALRYSAAIKAKLAQASTPMTAETGSAFRKKNSQPAVIRPLQPLLGSWETA
jgi:hypothetical protein